LPIGARAAAYLVLTVLGAVVPAAMLGFFVADYGWDVQLLADQLTGSWPACALLADLTIASVTFWVWLGSAAPKAGIRHWWLFIVANLLVGLCFALPLFLYVRERRGQIG
jgi:uncharacterized protein DUF2834